MSSHEVFFHKELHIHSQVTINRTFFLHQRTSFSCSSGARVLKGDKTLFKKSQLRHSPNLWKVETRKFRFAIVPFNLRQGLENFPVDLVHIECLQGWEGPFHSKKRNDWLVHSCNGYDKITFSGLHKSPILNGGQVDKNTLETIDQNEEVGEKHAKICLISFFKRESFKRTYLFFVDFNKSSIPNRFRDFVGSSLECASLLACLNGNGRLSAGGLCLRGGGHLFCSSWCLFRLGLGRRYLFLRRSLLRLGSLGGWGFWCLSKALRSSSGDHDVDQSAKFSE